MGGIMELKDLAPWIAIAFTLALSILVPLFTQIANNCHQRKLLHENHNREDQLKRISAYEDFLSDVGGTVTAKGYFEKSQLSSAGSALHKLYAYAPIEWFDDLDLLTTYISTFKWDEARALVQKLSRLIAEELRKQSDELEHSKRKKRDLQ